MSDELDMEMDRILRTAVTAAGQVAERAARVRANQDRLSAEQEATTRRALEQAHKEEVQAARAVYGGVHQTSWFAGEEADVQRRFGAALVTAHAMAGVDPVARVAEAHLLREARARYADAEGWMAAAVAGYTEAMAELRDRDRVQADADRAETATAGLEGPARVPETLVLEDQPGRVEPPADREEVEVKRDLGSATEETTGQDQALTDQAGGRSVDELDRALDAWSRELGDRGEAEDLTDRAHRVHEEEDVEEQALAVQEVVEEGFPVEAQVDHARHVGKAGAKTRGGRVGERSRVRTQDRGR